MENDVVFIKDKECNNNNQKKFERMKSKKVKIEQINERNNERKGRKKGKNNVSKQNKNSW